ncbi:MAG: alpha-N-acetylglucosaminidase [Oscillospiraceae bacterium]|nr:alpha-N-acetylglucosaminidase [Oscillospiraceae bacterium]
MLEGLIQRRIPDIASWFRTESLPVPNAYEIGSEEGLVLLRGGCVLSQAVALRRYLTEVLGADIAFSGNRAVTLTRKLPGKPVLPAEPIRGTIPSRWRGYLSPLSFAHSACWWDWPRWEQEIDWMALYGVNLPLLLTGSAYLWYDLLRKEHVSNDYILNGLSGTVFWPRHLMGQLDSYYPPVDPVYLKAQTKLGRQAADRMRAFGMTPVLPGFSGLIPDSLAGLLKDARSVQLPSWQGFDPVRLLDPACPAFARMGKAYHKILREQLGETTHFWSNPFYGQTLPSAAAQLLPRFGRTLFDLYREDSPGAVWVQRGDEAPLGLAADLPAGAVLYWDTTGDPARYGGQAHLAGLAAAPEGRTVLHGNAAAAAAFTCPAGSAGAGFFPDEPEGDPLLTTLRLEGLTRGTAQDLPAFLRRYARSRYGSEYCAAALERLCRSCYAQEGPEPGSIFCQRPSTQLGHTAPGDSLEAGYTAAPLFEAVRLLLEDGTARAQNRPGWRYDLRDVLRQAMSRQGREFYLAAMEGFRAKDPRAFERNSNDFLYLLEDCDRLLRGDPAFSLPARLTAARNAAKLDAERNNFELILLTQVTTYGAASRRGRDRYLLHDTAWREWGDLLGTFHRKRWRAFFELLAAKFRDRGTFSLETRRQPLGRSEYATTPIGKSMAKLEQNWLANYHPTEEKDDEPMLALPELAAELLGRWGTAGT